MTLIFERSAPGRYAHSQTPRQRHELTDIPETLRRQRRAVLPEVSELQVVRHYTNLSRKNFSIDTQFYPLGSCTMKYNPRARTGPPCCRAFSRGIRWRRCRTRRAISPASTTCRKC